MTIDQFASAVLQGLGITPNAGNMRAMRGWAKAEGGHTNGARYNYYNTTQSMPGAGNTGAQGNIKVYTSWDQGVAATVKTLQNGYYGDILSALKSGDARAAGHAIATSKWGTGALAERVINATSAPTSTRTYLPPGTDSSSIRVPGPVKQVSGGTSTDVEGAILDTLMGHHHGSMAKDLMSKLDSGTYTTDNPTKMVPAGPGITTPSDDGSLPASVDSIINRADIIGGQHRKYLYGGGHGGATLDNPQPLDCSGAVSLALGIKPRTSGQFNTIGQAGKGLVNLYYNNGHVFMSVMRGGKEMFWGTSGFGHPGSGTGAGWFTVQPGAKYLSGFQVRHVA